MDPAVLRDVQGIQQLFDQNGNAGNPDAVIRGIGLLKIGTLGEIRHRVFEGHGIGGFLIRAFGDRIVVNGQLGLFQRLFVFHNDNSGFLGGSVGFDLSQECVCVEFLILQVKLVAVGVDGVDGSGVVVRCFLGLA